MSQPDRLSEKKSLVDQNHFNQERDATGAIDATAIRDPDVRFLLLPLDQFSMLPFGGFLDKLRFSADEEDYSKQQYCTWSTIGLEKKHVLSSSGIPLAIETTFEEVDLADYEYLVVFGGRSARQSQQLANQYQKVLAQASKKGVTLVSIDNACFLFAEAGLIDRHTVAVHWRHRQEFQTAFPNIDVSTDKLFSVDNTRISCAGGSAAIDLAVELLSRHCGRAKALKGLADMLVDDARSSNHALKSLLNDVPVISSRPVSRAIGLMRHWLSESKTIDHVATKLAISRRQLDRLFHLHLNQSAREYWAEMRLQHVYWRVVNSDHNLQHLADEIGVQDVSYLCKIFKKRFGMTPKSARTSSSK
ncbi:GlxA family transcriptional regulator [Vibrio amylolyticus]|uniref:GlxA family transcriptional regulator n=1 Tax=Vibrio amylolyticus TaxID=2847292 RepID=UPI003550289E